MKKIIYNGTIYSLTEKQFSELKPKRDILNNEKTYLLDEVEYDRLESDLIEYLESNISKYKNLGNADIIFNC